MDHRLRPNRLIQWAAPPAALWLTLWAMALSASMAVADQAYTVKRGDTVFTIAQRYGTTPAALAERNGLSRNYYIYAGQRLMIPGKVTAKGRVAAKSAPAQKPARAALPRPVQRDIDEAPVRAGRWKYIVIHHSGVDTGTMRTMDKYHREVRHMENGLAYHFVIGNGDGIGDGAIGVTRRWTRQLDGGHLASEAQNKIALGICLVGNFDRHRPTPRQIESLRALVEALMARCQLAPGAVKTHQQVNVVHTRCPGAQFPGKSFLDLLQGRGG